MVIHQLFLEDMYYLFQTPDNYADGGLNQLKIISADFDSIKRTAKLKLFLRLHFAALGEVSIDFTQGSMTGRLLQYFSFIDYLDDNLVILKDFYIIGGAPW